MMLVPLPTHGTLIWLSAVSRDRISYSHIEMFVLHLLEQGSQDEIVLKGGIGGTVVTEELLDTLHTMIGIIREAMHNLPRICSKVAPNECFPPVQDI